MLPMEQDELDQYRKEYNKMLLSKMTGTNGIIQEKVITLSINKKNIEEARSYFSRVGTDLINHFKELGSTCIELDAKERLRIFHDFYRVGEDIMLNQAATDRLELAKLLNISDLQTSYITNVNVGEGLIKIGSSLIPFVNKFPNNTNLYKLMTTKFEESTNK